MFQALAILYFFTVMPIKLFWIELKFNFRHTEIYAEKLFTDEYL